MALACGCGPGGAGPPNIVLIIGDDHGWPYFGFMGNTDVETPHLDALAREGVLFPNAFDTASSCRPSLMTLLTGLYPIQWHARVAQLRADGIRRARDDQIRDFETLPRLLAANGYRTFQGGKYWEGDFANAGFEEGTKPPADPHPKPETRYAAMQRAAGGSGLSLGRETMEPLWEFLARDDPRPFFVWFAPKLPHTPHDAPARFETRYAERNLSPAARRYYANITRFDARVGEIAAFLDLHDLSENTWIVYLSDNGWQQDPHADGFDKALGGPRGKASMYELGFRTPLIFRRRGHFPAGNVFDDMVSTVDLFPTLLSLAGVAPPAGRSGRDLSERIYGRGAPARDAVFGSSNQQVRPPIASGTDAHRLARREHAWFARTARWRYVWFPEAARWGDRGEDALYRIDRDPRELHDLAAQYPDRVAELRGRIEAWREEALATVAGGEAPPAADRPETAPRPTGRPGASPD